MNQKSRFRYFVIASVLLHISVAAVLLLNPLFKPTVPTSTAVEISFVEPPENIAKPEVNPKAIVETDAANANDELSSKARYLSEKNNTVLKETKAKTGKVFVNVNKPAIQVKAQQKQPKPSKPQLFTKSFDAYGALTKKQNSEIARNQQRNIATAGEASTTNDSLLDVEESLITRLNTKEYKYFGYYNRIKNQLNQWWVPKVQQKFNKMLSQGRAIASEDNKITKLVIILNDAGLLIKVQVLAESGVKDLDEAAIEAFRSAAPFPNPPKGIIESDGTVHIRWDCVVES